MKYVIWGATASARKIYKEIEKNFEIVAFVDNSTEKIGTKLDGYEIVSPSQLKKIEYDKIAILSISALYVIKEQILGMGISEHKIDTSFVETKVRARINFLSDFAKIVYRYNVQGSVAEAGVFQGEFAKEMNKYFPDKFLYLFDTFEGFDKRDIQIEEACNYSEAKEGYLNITSEKLVLSKMSHPEKCIIRKGYFPETAIGINDDFCFVNLDMDLYKPTIEGLRFFWDKMVDGGIIIVHDYYSEGYKGVRDAVSEFTKEEGLLPFPIGDSISIAIKKC